MHDELLAAILEAPDDDSPRLVYADALLERGDPRGELIQIQCALAKRRAAGERIEHEDPLAKRNRGLLAKHEKDWLVPIRAHLRSWTWSRGFVEVVDADGEKFIDGAAIVFAEHPVRSLKLTKMKPVQFERLANTALGTTEILNLEHQKMGPKAAPFFLSPHLHRIVELDILSNPLKDAGAKILGSAQHLTSLTRLKMASTEIGFDGLDALSRASFFPRLEGFYVGVPLGWRNRNTRVFGPNMVDYLLKATSLVTLSIFYCHIGDQGIEALVNSPNMANLEHMYLEGNEMTDAGLMMIAKSPYLTRLRSVPDLFGRDGGLSTESPGANAMRERFGESVFSRQLVR
jgi:uncharacterized protein (TIGR02996 family)